MEFNIKKDVSTEKKVDLMGLTIEESYFDGIVNPMLLNIFFTINSIITYTDIEISQEEKKDKLALYDKFKNENILSQFEMRLQKELPGETNYLNENLAAWVKEYNKYKSSFGGVLESLKMFIDNIAQETDLNLQKLQDVDLNKFKDLNEIVSILGTERDVSSDE